jgi:RHH-type proline utilization regulon transcriptional repressor/proline dehydrogenase/delta 1-pyrroline-5-carboxylate dehydrogenase
MPRKPGEGGVKLATGSHNIRSIAHILALLEKHGLPESAYETQKLSGMGEQLRAALSQRGMRIREYAPVGEMIPGMAYFVRRLLENTSNQSWLRAGFSDEVSDDVLLASPHVAKMSSAQGVKVPQATRHALTPAVEGLGDGLPMLNESMCDFSQASARERFARAVATVKVPVVSRKVTADEARKAIAAATAALPAWRDRDVMDRAQMLVKAATLMRDRRDELSAIMIREAGKPWREADADTCEAIDFCEYYARCAVGLFTPQRLGQFVGELNHQWHQPRGVTSVISPWNFPLAICCGMTTAALVVGNPALVKPSTQTRGIAQAMCDILRRAFPKTSCTSCPARDARSATCWSATRAWP